MSVVDIASRRGGLSAVGVHIHTSHSFIWDISAKVLSQPRTLLVYAIARNLACQWGNNSWQCAWGSVAMRVKWSSACHVVAKILKCSKIYVGYYDLSQRNCLMHMRDIGCHAFREQFITYAWHMVRYGTTKRHPAVLTNFVPHCNGTTLHVILWGIAGTKFVPVWGLLMLL